MTVSDHTPSDRTTFPSTAAELILTACSYTRSKQIAASTAYIRHLKTDNKLERINTQHTNHVRDNVKLYMSVYTPTRKFMPERQPDINELI